MATMRIQYYGAHADGSGRIVEILVTREGPSGDLRQVAQEPTGVVYRTLREACRALEAKNAAFWRAQQAQRGTHAVVS